jgi:hypothetical protein
MRGVSGQLMIEASTDCGSRMICEATEGPFLEKLDGEAKRLPKSWLVS